MKEYKFTMPLEIRSSQILSKSPEYIVRGYGAVPNSPEIYGHVRDKGGNVIKSFKSLFTENAIKSMNKQAQHKKIFTNAEHKTGVSINVSSYLDKINISKEDKDKILQQVDLTDLPLAKVKEVSLEEETGKLIYDIRLNPHYKTTNPSYFDAVWGSLQDGFINGLSSTFQVTKFIDEDGIKKIDDVDLYGIEFTGGSSSTETNIFEVAMRASQEFSMEEKKMEQEMERRQKDLESREKALTEKENAIKEAETKTKEAEIKKQMEENKELKEKLQKELEEKAKSNSSASRQIVQQEDKYGQATSDFMAQLKVEKEVRELINPDMMKTSKNPKGVYSLGHVLKLAHDVPSLIQGKLEQLEPLARSQIYGTDGMIAERKLQ